MEKNIEQRVAIKFCDKFGFTVAETFKMVKAVESKSSGLLLTISSTSRMCTTLWLCCLAVSTWGTNLAQIFHFLESSVKFVAQWFWVSLFSPLSSNSQLDGPPSQHCYSSHIHACCHHHWPATSLSFNDSLLSLN